MLASSKVGRTVMVSLEKVVWHFTGQSVGSCLSCTDGMQSCVKVNIIHSFTKQLCLCFTNYFQQKGHSYRTYLLKAHSPKSIPIWIGIPSWIPNLGWNSKLNTDSNWKSKLNSWSVGRVHRLFKESVSLDHPYIKDSQWRPINANQCCSKKNGIYPKCLSIPIIADQFRSIPLNVDQCRIKASVKH